MNCEQATDWLYRVESPQELSGDLAEHVRACSACESVWQGIVRLEETWRAEPLPSASARSQAAFLNRLATQPKPRRPLVSWRRLASWSLAACVLLAVGAASYMLGRAGRMNVEVTPTILHWARAEMDVLYDVADWYVEMVEASAEERGELAARHLDVQAEVHQAFLSPDNRALADKMLARGLWLAQNAATADAVATAEIMDELTGDVQVRFESAISRGDKKEMHRIGACLNKLEKGLNRQILKAERSPQPEETKKKWEKVKLQNAQRRHRVSTLLENSPELKRPLAPHGKGKHKGATP